MPATTQCPVCSHPITSSAEGGHCIACLLQLGLESNSRSGGAVALPTAAELTALIDGFEVNELLGHGGMGAVYKATQTNLDRLVAIKILIETQRDDILHVERFIRESKTLAKLQHPNIVTVFDAGHVQHLNYIIMEYVDGDDLNRYVRELGPAAPQQATEWIAQAADGLAYAHRKGIIHRDVKPANLLLEEDGRIKILDLGLARFDQRESEYHEGSLTDPGHMMGTIDFMSPEQAENTREADARSDIYSLGCTLYYLLTGSRLFHEETPVKTIVAHREKPAPQLCDFVPDLPSEVNGIFQQMVAKSPDDRQSTMAEVAEQLRSIKYPPRPVDAGPQEQTAMVLQAEYDTSRCVTETVVAPAEVSKEAAVDIPTNVPPRRVVRWRLTLCVLLFFCGAFAVYRIQTDRGMLVVRIDESASTDVRLRDDGVEIINRENGESQKIRPREAKPVPSGIWRIQPIDGMRLTARNEEGVELDTERFVIRRNDRVVLAVTRVEAEDKPAPPAPHQSLDGDSTRQVAEVLLKACDIQVELESNGESLRINLGEALPSEPFRIWWVRMWQIDGWQQSDIDYLVGKLTDLRSIHHGKPATDLTMKILQGATSLEHFECAGSVISDVGLSYLNAETLTRLKMDAAPNVTDAGLVKFTNLTFLYLYDCPQVNGSCLQHMPKLEHCAFVKGPNITDESLAYLRQMSDLTHVEFYGLSRVTDVGYGHLGKLVQLQSLGLQKCELTDARFKLIRGLVHLENLHLLATEITDESLELMANMKKLTRLHVRQTQVTPEGVKELQKALPNCEILHDFGEL